MRYKNPNITEISGLKGIEKRIQQIQVKLGDEITWLELSFGLAQAVKKQVDDEVQTIPVVYVNSSADPLDMRPFPDDAYKSYCFFDLIDEVDVNYSDNFSVRRFPAYTYSVAIIFMYKLPAINPDITLARSLARHDILDFFNRELRFSGTFQINNIIEKDVTEIFERYDIADELIILRDQIAGIRIEGLITFKHDC